jgi:hypothetical protein
MKDASISAFKLLKFSIEESMKFPIMSEIIVVDTTGINMYFRNEMIKLCNTYNYNPLLVLFNFENDVFIKQSSDITLSFNQNAIIKKEVLKSLIKVKSI